MNFYILNLGCKVNRVESDTFNQQLSHAGATPTCENDADLIIINTCVVTGDAEKKARKALHHALRENNHADIIVTGCASAVFPNEFDCGDDRVRIVAKSDVRDFLDSYIANDLSLKNRSDQLNTAVSNLAVPEIPARMLRRSRVGVKVQDGCNNICTYCIVRVARGKSVSRSVDEIIAECTTLADEGIREIVLTGINLGSYSYENVGLVQLLNFLLDSTREIHATDEYPTRFRISSIEPMDINDDLINLLIEADGRICKHLHLPLQSGSSRILQKMARPYDAFQYLELIKKIRRAIPFISLTTDAIVGFPGEDENDFQQTCDLSRACCFSKMHIFPYSKRLGTPAADFTDQIEPEIKQSRAFHLRTLAQELRNDDFARRKGTCELSLVAENTRAMTESYYEIDSPQNARIGRLVPCVL